MVDAYVLHLSAVVGFVSATGAAAAGCSQQTVEIGIVKAMGCWTQSTSGGATIYTADFGQNRGAIDLNGFVVTNQTGTNGIGLQINATTRVVRSVEIANGQARNAQLNSRNWPVSGKVEPIGGGTKLDFIAPLNSDLLLENLHLGKLTALAGLSPVGDVATPVYLHPGGTGSMDLTVLLAGIFTLKDKPQSVTIDLPTTPGEGTRVDGFEIKLQEIDAIKAFTLNNFFAKYSASQNVVADSKHIISLRETRWKIAECYDANGKVPSQWEMYDLKNDPLERTNLAHRGYKRTLAQQKQYRRLRRKLARVKAQRLRRLPNTPDRKRNETRIGSRR